MACVGEKEIIISGFLTDSLCTVRSFNLRSLGTYIRTRPTLLNAASGLIATLINVYTAQGGSWSIMALMATIVTALTVSVSLGLFIIYRFGKLLKIRQEHDREMIAEFH
jgi:hypothetical protein